jgi:hypothetical protein
MKHLLTLLFSLALGSAAFGGQWVTQQVFEASGTDDAPLFGLSHSGAPAAVFDQDTHFSSPAVSIIRSGSAGGDVASSPLLFLQCGLESTGTTPLAQMGGCLSLTGDNWVTLYCDGSLSLPGGLLDNVVKAHGNLSVDPVHRQLVAEDGLTAVLLWTGGGVTIHPRITPPASPVEGMIYYDAVAHHFYGWNGSAWKQLDN